MAFKVVHADQRLVVRERDGFAGEQPNHDAADEARPGCSGDPVDIGEPQSCVAHGGGDRAVEAFDVSAGGDLRDDASVRRVVRSLAEDDVGDDVRAILIVQESADPRISELVGSLFDSFKVITGKQDVIPMIYMEPPDIILVEGRFLVRMVSAKRGHYFGKLLSLRDHLEPDLRHLLQSTPSADARVGGLPAEERPLARQPIAALLVIPDPAGAGGEHGNAQLGFQFRQAQHGRERDQHRANAHERAGEHRPFGAVFHQQAQPVPLVDPPIYKLRGAASARWISMPKSITLMSTSGTVCGMVWPPAAPRAMLCQRAAGGSGSSTGRSPGI